ncbi:MAG: aspartate-semialdehyde dehydrogenase, partial [Polyangiales bacterium]
MPQPLNVAVLGATGLVGRAMLEVLEQRSFPVRQLTALASSRSAGQSLVFRGTRHTVQEVSEAAFTGVDVALFSAGGGTSKQWAPVAAAAGAIVIDNSSAWRMDPEVPLCVPEVNLAAANFRPKGIIANPNCSTIQMLVALHPLHLRAGLRRIDVATYQAVSGAGIEAVQALARQHQVLAAGDDPTAETALGGVLAGNLLMSWTPDAATGYSEEELKLMRETRKILAADDIEVSATAVRVPVTTGHAEAVTLTTQAPLSATQARTLLHEAPGVRLVDDFAGGLYPTPADATGQDPVLVGRVRQVPGNLHALQLWVVADNLRKGAALNAVQIAEGLLC